MIRAFLALPLPGVLADQLVPVQAALDLPRPVAEQDFHVTLAFLGDVREDLLEDLHLALEAMSLRAPRLRLTGLGAFGGAKPQSVHATIEADPALEALAQRVSQAARQNGITLEKRRFTPHVTLGRGPITDPEALARRMGRIGSVTSPAITATSLALWRSRLRPEGPLYDILTDYPLHP